MRLSLPRISARAPGLLFFAALASSCAPFPAAQPVAQDPFAKLFDSAPAAYPDVRVAVIVSENTKNSFESGMKNSWYPGLREFAESLLERDAGMLKKNFKSAVRVQTLDEANKSGADLVVVMDILVQYMRTEYAQTSFVFLTPDGRTVETLKTEGRRSYMGCLNALNCLKAAADEAQEKLLRALHDSTALAEFAKAKGGASAAAAPVKTYRSDVDQPNYRAAERPDDFALVVGVERYKSLPPAEFAERDADAVRRHLVALGYPERNVVFLTGADASRTGIEKYVETWLPLNVKPDSRVFVYFSGHGAPDAVTSQAYLVPWDGDAKFLKDTGYPIKRLYDKLGRLNAKQVVLAMDSCFSGEGGRSVLAKGARPLVTTVDVGMAADHKLVVFAASAANEITDSAETQGHGLFTYYLLKGLNADGGNATVKRLYDYLLPRVRDDAHRDGREQTPQLFPAELGDRAATSL